MISLWLPITTRARALFAIAVLLLTLTGISPVMHGARAATTANSAGAEFGGLCAMGLAEGKRLRTDCSINWVDKDGRKYCFGSTDARTVFLENPPVNIEKARDYLASSDVEDTGKAMSGFTSDEVKTFIAKHVEAATKKGGGVFRFRDTSIGQDLELVYVEFNLMRTLDGYGYFPDLVFHSKDDAQKKYWVDFWVKPRAGKLEVIDTRIYKGPKKVDETWQLQTRQPRPWWWIPASEHPGKMEAKRGWEVMSALEEHIVSERERNGGKFQLRDDATGKLLNLDFVGTHQPVRKLSDDGRYFACTDFREEGTTDQYYDVDFWLDDKTGRMSVTESRVHKVPVLEDGTWIQKPRYNFDGLKFEVVP